MTSGKGRAGMLVLFLCLCAVACTKTAPAPKAAVHLISEDFVKQYEIVVKKDGPDRFSLDQCAAARLVKAAYLQEKNEREYRSWDSLAEICDMGFEMQDWKWEKQANGDLKRVQ